MEVYINSAVYHSLATRDKLKNFCSPEASGVERGCLARLGQVGGQSPHHPTTCLPAEPLSVSTLDLFHAGQQASFEQHLCAWHVGNGKEGAD